MINEFHNRSFSCSLYVPAGPGYDTAGPSNRVCNSVGSTPGSGVVNGDAYINSAFQYYHSHKWRNFGIIIAFMLFFMFTYLTAAEYISSKKSKGEVLVFRRGHKPAALTKSTPDDMEAATGRPALLEKEGNGNHDPSKAIQKQTSIFHWQDVCYDIKIKSETRRILDHVDGWVKPGTLTALMVSKATLIHCWYY